MDTRLWELKDEVAIKVCGVRTFETALEIADIGVDAIGFHLFRGRITREGVSTAGEICQLLPDDVSRVVLTDLVEPTQIASLLAEIGADTLQLQSFPPHSYVEELKGRVPRLRIIKALAAGNADQMERMREDYEPHVDAFLIDKSASGGTSETYDWNIAKNFAMSTRLPVMIAGGLNAENVAQAISIARPYAVDVESSVEKVRHIEPGRIKRKWTSIRKVIEFQDAVRMSHQIRD